MNTTKLCDIMKKHGSDKSSDWHNYTITYFDLFSKYENENINIFELGLGTNNLDVPSNMGSNYSTGASVRGWKEFFKNANIYGADVDKRILFTEDRINTFYVDQTNFIDIAAMWNDSLLRDVTFDIMIDDGLHEKHSTVNFFIQSYFKLKIKGIYIIEDIQIKEIEQFEKALNKLKNILNFNFEIKNIFHEKNNVDNVIAVIEKNN
jgi:hypothetical protein